MIKKCGVVMVIRRYFLKLLLSIFVFYFLLIFITSNSILFAKSDIKKISVAIGQTEILDFNKVVKRVSISNPDIADATVTSTSQLLINGKQLGTTTLIVWDERDNYRFFKVVVHSQASSHQVMLQVQFLEVNRINLKELGVDFWTKDMKIGSEKVNVGSFGGQVNTPNDPLLLSDNVSFFLSLPTQNISSIIKALAEKNLLTILSKPNLSAINGAEASFLAGGEFPIPIISGSAGTQSVSIQFKEFGVRLKFVPTVIDSDLVNIKVLAEVSSLDFENGIILSGFRIPSLTTRKAETTVELNVDQFLVIGGLLSSEMVKTISKIPVLGQIPLIGKLFSSSRFMNKESELVIMVSPKIKQAEMELPDIKKIK
jgi:pilus assembly protein CpaC